MNDRFDILEKQSNDTDSRLEKLSKDINELRGDMTERRSTEDVW